MKKVITKSDKETKKLASKIASSLKGGEVLALVGDLGAGKTTFTQGLAEYFGVAEQVSSPTFTLINEYMVEGSKIKDQRSKQTSISKNKNSKPIIHNSKFIIRTLVHIDCYRLEKANELIEIGIEDYLARKDSVTIIEWAEKTKDILPKNTKWIYFEHSQTEAERIIKLG